MRRLHNMGYAAHLFLFRHLLDGRFLWPERSSNEVHRLDGGDSHFVVAIASFLIDYSNGAEPTA